MSPKFPEVSIFQSELRTLHSEKTGMDYLIPVWFPPGYPSSRSTYPVVYVLDASAWFGMCANIALALVSGSMIGEVILVGVAYPLGERGYDTFFEMRNIDFYPPGLYSDNGRAPQFLEFLKDELIPFVESNYPADRVDRTLWGISSSGFFALYTLFHEPNVFSRIIAGSAFWESGCDVLLQYEQELAKKQSNLPVKLYLSVGGLEEDKIPYFEKVSAAIRNRNYNGLDLKTQILDGEVHMTQIFPSFLWGMRWLFSNSIE